MISDTTPTSYVGWGPATECTGRPLGVVSPPATEADRCRLAAFFTRLVERDSATLAWTRGFVAADHVQRTIIAAEQGIEVINLAFVADIPWLTLRPMRAGAGISAWGGAIRINPWTGRVLDHYPAYHAIRQMMGHLAGYESVRRIPHDDERVRIYRVEHPDGGIWVGWLDPGRAITPDDPSPSVAVEVELDLPPDVAGLAIEPVITAPGQSEPHPRQAPTPRTGAGAGAIRVTLSHAPVYLLPAVADGGR